MGKSIIIIGAGIAGLPPAAVSGRNIIQILCKHDRTRFVAGKP